MIYNVGFIMNAITPFLYCGITGFQVEHGLRRYERTYENGGELILYEGGRLKACYFALLVIQLILLISSAVFMMDGLRRIRGAIELRDDVLVNVKIMGLHASAFGILLVGLAFWCGAEVADRIFARSSIVDWTLELIPVFTITIITPISQGLFVYIFHRFMEPPKHPKVTNSKELSSTKSLLSSKDASSVAKVANESSEEDAGNDGDDT